MVRRYRLVGAGPDPRICSVALAALLQLLDQIVEAAAQDVSSRAAAKQCAEAAAEQIAKTATAARGTGRSLTATGETFECLVGEQSEDRHGDRRHAAGTRARIALSAVEDVQQAHVTLLSREK